ncbi:MAG: SIR2 family protein [Phycisphaerae bacterium]|nr:SIR2 family protein [Phycisphaerae bacterium]
MSKRFLGHLSDVVSTLRESPFVLFLGAGVNGSLCPKWKEVLAALRKVAFGYIRRSLPGVSPEQFGEHCGSLSYETQAEVYKLILGSTYEACLKRAIYTSDLSTGGVFDKRELDTYMRTPRAEVPSLAQKYQLLRDVARLSQYPTTIAVLTLNYDNYLEMSIASLVKRRIDKPGHALSMRVPYSMPGGGACRFPSPSRAVIPIHHIHGFLPYPTADLPKDSEDIVLSQDEYIAAFNNAIGVSNCTAIHYLTHYPALFIGLSMCDWNLLRFLRASQSSGRTFPHYCILKEEGHLDRIRMSLLQNYGVRVLPCSSEKADGRDSYAPVRRTVRQLCDELDRMND